MPAVSLGETALHVRVHGPANGAPVLLLHGYPLDGGMWRNQVNALTSAGFRSIVPDLPGHGLSPVLDPMSIATMTDAVVATLRSLKIGACAVVGFSMGGYVAMDLALRHPGLVSKLVLIDTRAEPDTPQGRDGRMALLREMTGPLGMKVVATAMMPGLLTQDTRGRAPMLAEEVRLMMLRQKLDGGRAAMLALADRPDRRGDLGSIRAPTLVVWGTEDKVMPEPTARTLVDGIPGARLETIAGAAHLAPMEQPEAVNRALLAFL